MAGKRRSIGWWGVVMAAAAFVGYELITERPVESPGFQVVDAVSAATAPGVSVVGLMASDDERLPEPVGRDASLTEAQVEQLVRQAVALAGGLQHRLDPDARWVVIKPNIVELKERGSGVITDWRVVKALVKIVHEAAPEARVTIAEGGAWVPPDHTEVLQGMYGPSDGIGDGFAVAGFRPLPQDPDLAGIDLDILDLNFDEPVEVSVPGGGYVFEKYQIPNAVLECDFLISVPVLKIIGGVGMTNAMKNFVGIAPGMIYGWPKMQGYPGSGSPGLPHHPSILDEVIVDLVSVAEADFAVVDAIVGMERAKTDEDQGVPVRLNTIVASADLVAADAVSARLIGLNPDDIEYLALAAYRGLGQMDPERIKIKGGSLAQLRHRFERYHLDNHYLGDYGHYGQGCRTWVLKGPFATSAGAVGASGEYIDVFAPAAAPGENGWSQPLFFHDDKIDLDKYYDNPFDCVVYAYADFTAPKAQDAELWVGSDEGLRVWINGERVYDHQGRRRHSLPNDRLPVRVRQGANTLLVRADQSRSRFDFSLNLCEVEPDPRYDGNRVDGLRFTVPSALAADQTSAPPEVQELRESVAEGPGEIPEDAHSLGDVRVERTADRLIGALAACLGRAGVQLPPARLMGLSGHAFRACVGDSLERDYLREYDASEAVGLYGNLGLEVRRIRAAADAPELIQRQQEAWQAITASIDRGMPALVNAGWSYRLATGYHPVREEYYLSGSRRGPSAVPVDELGTDEWSGGLEVIVFGPPRAVEARDAELASLRFALREARHADEPGSHVHCGLAAYEHWIDCLEANALASTWGVSSTTAVLAEARAAARDYVLGLAAAYPAAAGALRRAADAYGREASELGKLAELFPYRARPAVNLEEAEGRARAAAGVRQALTWERQAVAALEEALPRMSR